MEWTPTLVAIAAVDAVALVLIWGFLLGGFVPEIRGYVPEIGFWAGAVLGIVGMWAFTRERRVQAEALAEEE